MSFTLKKTPLIISLFLVINLSNISTNVNGDSTLIQNVCAKTPNPTDCQNCFNNNSGAVQMTVRELAGSAMYCTYNLSLQVQESFVALAGKTENPTEKKVYETCGVKIYNYADKLAGAQNWWWNYNDEEAKKDFNGAKDEYESCEHELKEFIRKGVNDLLPSIVALQFKGLSNLYSDSYAIIVQSEKSGGDV